MLPPNIDIKDMVVEVNAKLTEVDYCGNPSDDRMGSEQFGPPPKRDDGRRLRHCRDSHRLGTGADVSRTGSWVCRQSRRRSHVGSRELGASGSWFGRVCASLQVLACSQRVC